MHLWYMTYIVQLSTPQGKKKNLVENNSIFYTLYPKPFPLGFVDRDMFNNFLSPPTGVSSEFFVFIDPVILEEK